MYQHISKILLIVVWVLCGCDKMLDVTPEDKVTGGNFWQNKSEVESSMIGGYSKLQGCVSSFLTWSELRSELVTSGKSDGARLSVMDNTLAQDNDLCKWGSVYAAINQFNAVLDYAPAVMAADKSFTATELDYYLGEAKTIRALCYFYLARTFQTFPYVTVSSKTDQQEYKYPGIPGTQVLDSLIADLKWAENRVRKDYSDKEFSTIRLKSMYEKGRVTQPVVWALLADIYLTRDQYAEALVYIEKILADKRFSLMNSVQWYENFYPGNSNESIFELQFSAEYENSGDMVKWFSNKSGVSGEQWYLLRRTLSTQTFKYWEGDDRRMPRSDARGAGGTYLSSQMSYTMDGGIIVWKWAGKKYQGSADDDYRDKSANDPNWIFYRLADIYLMKAEALNRMNQSPEALAVLKTIRERANVNEQLSYDDMIDLENKILDERAAELAFEGKRWFDLVRIARRQNDFQVISSRLANAWYQAGRVTYGEALVRALVNDPLSWYFPIHRSELDNNPNLVQNPYYKTN